MALFYTFFLFALSLQTEAASHTKDAVVVIMLDVNDTLLQDVDASAHANHPEVQTLDYKPGDGLGKKSLTPLSQVAIHPDGRVENSVTLRPGLVPFFSKTAPLLAAGKARIVLTSLGDPARTRAIHEQIRVAGKTLREWGVEVATPSEFQNGGTYKDFLAFRKSFRINASTQVIAIDDNPKMYIHSSSKDHISEVPAFTIPMADFYLDGIQVPGMEQQGLVFGEIANLVAKAVSSGGAHCEWNSLAIPLSDKKPL